MPVAVIATALAVLDAPAAAQVMWLVVLAGVLVVVATGRAERDRPGGDGVRGGLRRPRGKAHDPGVGMEVSAVAAAGARPRWEGLDRALVHAARAGRAVLGTEHVLLALCDDPTAGPARRALEQAGATQKTVTDMITAIMGSDTTTPVSAATVAAAPPDPPGEVTVAPTARDMLAEAAVLAAARPGSDSDQAPVVITDPDVLTAMLRAPEPGLAGMILARFGTGTIAHALDHHR